MKAKLLILIIIFISRLSFATTYFVATTGSDANNGTSALTPFLTLAKAESVVVAGDLVNVAAGTYSISSLSMTHNGTVGNLIEFRAAGGVTVNVSGVIGFDVSGAYRLLNGFTIVSSGATTSSVFCTGGNDQVTNCTFSGTFTRAVWFKTSANNLAQNLVITQNGTVGYGMMVGEDANTGGELADNNTLDNIRVIGTTSGTIHGIIMGGGGSGNTLKNSYISGTYYGIVDKAEISSNIFNNVINLNNPALSQLTCIYNKGSTNSSYNANICRASGSAYLFLIQQSDGGSPIPSGAILKNNIFVKGVSPAIFIGDGTTASAFTSDYNCYQYTTGEVVRINPTNIAYSSLGSWQAAAPTQDIHSIAASPTYVNLSGTLTQLTDWVPATGSPVINVGVAIGGRTTDAIGQPIVGTPDIGALENQSTPVAAHIYYISTEAGASDANPGTITQPWRNFEKLNSVTLVPSDIVYVRGGIYTSSFYTSTAASTASFGTQITNSGTAAQHITIMAYPPDFPSGGRVVYDMNVINGVPTQRHPTSAACYGIQSTGNYIDFQGISVKGPAQQLNGAVWTIVGGWWVQSGAASSATNVTVTNCEASYTMSGFRLDNVNNALFWNDDAHHLDDPFTGPPTSPHGGSDGFQRTASGNTATNTIYRGCRSWYCSDDGWDCYGTNGTITYDSCWSYRNGYDSVGTHLGDGNGFKMGGSPTNVPGSVTRFANNCLAVHNFANGYDQNSGTFVARFYNNDAINNGSNDWKYGFNKPLAHIFINNASIGNCPSLSGCAPIDGITTDAQNWGANNNNSWSGTVNLTTADFQSTDETQLIGARQANGTLPSITAFHLVSNSDLINAGANVGLAFCGIAPDIGAFETCGAVPPPLTVNPNFTIITCFGGTSTITVGVSGGTPPYQYQLNSNGFVSSNTFTGLTAGTYLISVKDAATATGSSTVIIPQPTQITISQSSPAITVNGGSTTTTVTASGGTGALQYKLDAGGFVSSNVFTGVLAGVHTITVRDANLCTNTLTYTLTQPTALTLVAAAATNPLTCNGNSTTVTLTATGGTTPYQYNVNGGSFGSSNIFTGTGAGIYTYSVKDATNATQTTTLTINQPSQITITQSSTAILINGGTSTTTVTASGGTGTLNYKLDAGSFVASNVFTGVTAGTHTITVRDANLCTNTLTYTLTQPAALLVSAAGTTNPLTCFGNITTITVTASGGTTPYQYSINGGALQSANIFSNRGAGTYTLTVQDAANATTTTTLTITQPTQISITESNTAIIVNGGTCTVTITASGGTGTLNYSLDGAAFVASNIFSGVLAGTHTVTVRDANLCTNAITFTITQPSVLTVTATGMPNPLSCFNNTTTIVALGCGGTAPYQYNINGGTFQSSGAFSNIGAGTYTIVVRDNSLVTATTTVTITQPTQIAITESHTTISVNGGTSTVTVTASGGTGTLNYSIDGGSLQSSNSFAGVLAGTHTVTVQDANICANTLSFTITQPSTLLISAAGTTNPLTCFGATTTITVTASGATPPYTYSINGGAFQSPNTFTGRGAGTYTLTARDANLSTATTTLTITQPTQISISESHTTIAINGGTSTVTVTASGGTGTLNFSIDGGSFQLSNAFSGVLAGNHTITVRDANLCTNTLTFTITQPTALVVTSAVTTAILCNGGTGVITVTPSGGTPPYTYRQGTTGSFVSTATFTVTAGTYQFFVLDGGGSIVSSTTTITQPTIISVNTTIAGAAPATVTVTASGGVGALQYRLDAGSFQSSNVFSAVSAGNHTVTVRDANLCTQSRTFNVGTPLHFSMVVGTILCNGGTTTVAVNATGGTPPYTGTGTFTRAAGTWTFSVNDATNAQADTTIVISQPAIMSIGVVTGTITINGGTTTATITATGGTGAKTYSMDGSSFQSSNVFTISAGNHTIAVRDANNCQATNSFSVSQPSNLLISVLQQFAINCNGGTTTVSVSGSGGTTPYLYGRDGTFQSSTSFTGTTAGTHTFSVRDAFLNQHDSIITITQPTALTLSVVTGTILTNGGNTTVTASGSGGTGSLLYSLDGGTYQSSGSFTGVLAGSHTVTLKDANNCTTVNTFSISQPGALFISLVVGTAISCNGGTTTVTVSGTGGTTPYTYGKNGTFQSAQLFSSITAGTYTFSVKDVFNAQHDTVITISQPTALSMTVTTGTITFVGGTTTVTAAASGGTPALQYKLDAGAYQGSGSFTGVAAGSHTVTVKDANNCTFPVTFTILQPLGITVTPGTAIACAGGTTTYILTGAGGTPPYTYGKNGTFQIGTGFQNLTAATYTFSIKDALSNQKDTVVTISQPTALSLSVVTGTISVNGGTTTVTATGAGGTGGLQYKLDNGAYQGSGVFASVAAGPHTITLKDANTCTTLNTFSISQPDALVITISRGAAITCAGGTQSITVGSTGGTAPITGTGVFSKLAGTYTFSVVDAFLAHSDTIITVSQPNQIAIAVAKGTITVNGGTTTVTASATGGTGALQYKLDAGAYQGTGNFTGVAAGPHTVTVQDASSCTNVNTFSIQQPGALFIHVTIATNPLVCNGNTTNVTVTATGGTQPYVGTGVTSKAAGTYTMTVVDAFGATHDSIITITQPAKVAVLTIFATPITVVGGTSTVTVSAVGGTGTLQYKLDAGAYQLSSTITNVAGGNHLVTVKDASNCTGTYLFSLYEPPAVDFYDIRKHARHIYWQIH